MKLNGLLLLWFLGIGFRNESGHGQLSLSLMVSTHPNNMHISA